MRVALMRTCLSDLVAPTVARSSRRVLEAAGIAVRVPRGQTCCGQPAWSSGHPEQARPVARRALRAFRDCDALVVPSGSCAAMIVHGYPQLFAGEPEEQQALELAGKTLEFSQFLARHRLTPPSSRARTVTHHDSCHMLRMLGERDSPRTCLDDLGTIELREMDRRETCCGFGGMFSLDFPEVSGKLGLDKARDAAATGAHRLVACDLSCLLHITGCAHRHGIPLHARHLAELIVEDALT